MTTPTLALTEELALAAVLKSVYRLARISVLLLTSSLCLSPAPQGQPETRKQFEVASVKLSDPASPRPFISNSPSRFIATNVPLILYIGTAYGVDTALIKGLPESMADAKYDITANAADPDDHRPAGAMRHWAEMQMLLEDRFKLRVRRETRVVPVLKLLRGKGELRLHKSERPPSDGPLVTLTPGKLRFVGISMENLALQLYRWLRAEMPVVDETDIDGTYDFSIEYALEEVSDDRPNASGPPSARIREVLTDLGLTLNEGRASREILVIVHIEKPTAN